MVSLMTMPAFSGITAKNDISQDELSRRIGVIKRFKELLKAQRDRFHAYLDSLDRQKDVIQSGSADDLLHYVELEEKIVSDIFSIQKVIDPLEKMYSAAVTGAGPGILHKTGTAEIHSEDEVSNLKDALEGLKAEALIRSEQNRDLLNKRMAEIRSEIKNMRSNPYARRRSGFDTATPTQIDIKG